MKLTVTAVLCALVAIALAPATARADGSVTADGVTATLVTAPNQFNETLTITARGAPPYSETQQCADICDEQLQVTRLGPGPRPDVVMFQPFEGGGSGTAVDDFSWSVALDTWIHASTDYTTGADPSVQPLGDGFSGFISHPGVLAFYIPGPIEIQRVIAGQFVDVTLQYPQLIEADAARQIRQFRHGSWKSNCVPLAGWAADESLLGRGALAGAFIESQDGHLFYGGQPVSAAAIEQALDVSGYPV